MPVCTSAAITWTIWPNLDILFMELSLAISPCPNDTFIFDALIHGLVDTKGIRFSVHLHDVEELNHAAVRGSYDITKLSFGAYPGLRDRYALLDSGGALGKGCGPLWVTSPQSELRYAHHPVVALPGEHTTAHFLFGFAVPDTVEKRFLRYDRIEDFVLSGQGRGVIIHESRFTYAEKGLQQVMDLGRHWEDRTGQPVPLGGIAMRRSFDPSLRRQVEKLIRRSLEHAWSHWPALRPFIRNHAVEMSEDVMREHIRLYVNEYTKTMGPKGRAAVAAMMSFWGVEEAGLFG